MFEKQPSELDYGVAKGLGALAAFFAAVFVYLRRQLGRNGKQSESEKRVRMEERITDLEKWRDELKWKQDVLDEIDRRHRPDTGPPRSEQ